MVAVLNIYSHITGMLRERRVKGSIDIYLVGLAYRGIKIRKTMVDYLQAVNRDQGDTVNLPNGNTLEYVGKSHVVGWVGHNYFMDEMDTPKLLKEGAGTSTLAKGVFGSAGVSDEYYRPGIQRRNTHILVLNKQLTFPSAFKVMGIIRGIAAGKNHKGIHREAAKAFATGQKRSVGTMMRVLAHGDKPL